MAANASLLQPVNSIAGIASSSQLLQTLTSHSKYYTMSQKNCAKLFLSQLRQISRNFDNFWQKDGKEAEIMQGALIFHLI